MKRLMVLATMFWAPLALAQSRLVNLTVAATDAKGNPVADLKAADIQVREDGASRPVAFFRFAGSKLPLSQPAPGEFLNRPAAPPLIILLDRWNEKMTTSATAWQDINAALSHMESLDRVYIYFLTNHGDLFPVHALPGADADLRSSVSTTSAQLIAKLNDAVRSLQGLRDADTRDPAVVANVTFQALQTLIRMAPMVGRTNLIWVTHGIPLNVRLLTGNLGDYTVPVRNLGLEAAQAEIAVYTVDQSAEGAGADVAGESRQTLQLLAAQTGGRWYASGRTDDAIRGARADARGTYRLAYDSPPGNSQKEHKIRLECTRKGVRLHTRDGYFDEEMSASPDSLADAAFRVASHSAFDATEIPLRVTMTDRPAGNTVHLEVHVDAADVHGSLTVTAALYKDGVFQKTIPEVLSKETSIPLDVPISGQIQQVRVMVFDQAVHSLGTVTVPIG